MSRKFLEQIKSCREKKKMSLKDLADKSGISYIYLYKLENGEKNNPSLNTIEKISQALDIEITFLLIKK